MKTFKRIQAMFLTVIMAIMTIGTTTAFAAEPQNEDIVWVEGEEFTVGSDSEITPRALTTIVNQKFNISGEHTGSTRTYNYYNVGVICSFKDRNGNIPSDGTILSIQLYNAAGQKVHEWQGSNGVVLGQTVPITYGGRYFFKYAVAYGTRDLNLEVLIVSSP